MDIWICVMKIVAWISYELEVVEIELLNKLRTLFEPLNFEGWISLEIYGIAHLCPHDEGSGEYSLKFDSCH